MNALEPSPSLFASGASEKARSADTRERFATLRSLVAYEGEWSANETTERLAYTQAIKLLPEVPAVRYFAFPWARLIDLLQAGHPDGNRLREELTEAAWLLKGCRTVATVCQHRDLLKHQELFAVSGMTEVFWTYTQANQGRFPDHHSVRLWPFPTAPVPFPASLSQPTKRSHLLSQVEAGKAPASGSWQLLQDSTFSLCPESEASWLWTSIACETIPVFLERIPPLPGNKSLWEAATELCPHGQESLNRLPAHLEKLAENRALLEFKRQALRQLRFLYGAECFIYDILKLFVSLPEDEACEINDRPGLSYGRLFSLAAQIFRGDNFGDSACVNVFTLGCCSRIIADPASFHRHYQGNQQFRLACQKAFNLCKKPHQELLHQILTSKGLSLQGCEALASCGEAHT